MQMAKCKVFFLVVLLLTYVSQGYAAAHMTCQKMALNADTAHHEMPMASDAGHAHHASMDSAEKTDAPNCCPDCDCLSGVCSTAALPVSLQTVSQMRSLATIDTFSAPTPLQVVFSLYRPPISR
jgi:hypothetical protein